MRDTSHRPLAMNDGPARQADWSDLGALAAFGTNGWNFGQGASGLGAATVQVDGGGGFGGAVAEAQGFGSQGFEQLPFVRDGQGQYLYSDGRVLSQMAPVTVTPEGMLPPAEQTQRQIADLFAPAGENAADRLLLHAGAGMAQVVRQSQELLETAQTPAQAAAASGVYAVNRVTQAAVDGAIESGRLLTSSAQRAGVLDGLRRLWRDPAGTIREAWNAFRRQPQEDQLAQVGASLAGVSGLPGRLGNPSGIPNTQVSVSDGDSATRRLLGTSRTPGGREVNFHAADRMVNPPRGRMPMTPTEVDQVLDGATRIVKRQFHPQGPTLTIENSNMPGRPRVVVDEETGKKIITVTNSRVAR